jgi:hypothetical protein
VAAQHCRYQRRVALWGRIDQYNCSMCFVATTAHGKSSSIWLEMVVAVHGKSSPGVFPNTGHPIVSPRPNIGQIAPAVQNVGHIAF